MIYIKYIWKEDPSFWSIWAHTKGEKVEHFVIDHDGETYPERKLLDLKGYRIYNKIKYLTQKEIDLLKLELL